jgi:hypothetical protein
MIPVYIGHVDNVAAGAVANAATIASEDVRYFVPPRFVF